MISLLIGTGIQLLGYLSFSLDQSYKAEQLAQYSRLSSMDDLQLRNPFK
jgi:hypothetical protein